jgi:DNA-binding response OmpR family regulator
MCRGFVIRKFLTREHILVNNIDFAFEPRAHKKCRKALGMDYSVVFIDDDEDDLEMLEHSVVSTFENLECLRFSSPILAVKYLSSPQVNPVCIFIDINMPIMRGDEVLQKIKLYDHLSEATIAILSTSITDHARDVLLRYGADYAIVKPSTFSELRDRVCDVIRHRLIRRRR